MRSQPLEATERFNVIRAKAFNRDHDDVLVVRCACGFHHMGDTVIVIGAVGGKA
jgi:hypothetical protein